MNLTKLLLCLTAALLLAVQVSGCRRPARKAGGGGEETGTPSLLASEEADLKTLYSAWYGVYDVFKRTPKDFDELKMKWPPGPETTDVYGKVQGGQIVVYWNDKLRDLELKKQRILAHYRGVSNSGGGVLFADGAVKSVSVAEFQRTPKANDPLPSNEVAPAPVDAKKKK